MKRMKKQSWIVLFLLLFAFLTPMTVLANAPMTADNLTVVIVDPPSENVVYVDLLIKIDENDANYVAFQPNAFIDTAQDAKGIVDYSKGGYRSFSFHFRDAYSDIRLQSFFDSYSVDFCNGSEYQASLTQYETLRQQYGTIKLALLDENFNVVSVSCATQLPKEDAFVVFDGIIYYDVANDSFSADTRINVYYIVFSLFVSLLVITLSVGTEVAMSLLFRFKGKQLLFILAVNVCSQVIMRLLYMVLPFAFLAETILLEILVYGTEFFVYRKGFKEMSLAKIAGYTVVANTLSLLLGLAFDLLILT